MKQKINFPYWLLIILLAAFAVGYWAWSESLRDQYTEFEIIDGGSTSSPTNSSLSQSKGKLKDWKTYRNEEYGFQFKIPPSFEVQIDTEKEYTSQVALRIGDNSQPETLWVVFWLEVLSTSKADLTEIVDEVYKDWVIFKKENYFDGLLIKTDGIPGNHYIRNYPLFNKFIIVSASDAFLRSEIFNQILSTFRFIE